MRCPKCGYISFDHLETCLKCSKDVSKAASQVVGTTYNAAPPSFLRFQPNEDIEVGGETEISFENGQEDFDVVDPDLNILVDADNDSAEDIGISFDDALGEGEELEVAVDGEGDGEDDVGLDLGQFEDAFEGEDSAFGEDENQFDIPDELADISDLSAPAEEGDAAAFSFDEPEESPVVGTAATGDGLDDFNLDLDDLGNDFSLSSPEEKEMQDDDMGLGSLSLDDIGILDSKEKPAKKEVDSMDMDGDLDFDLDLDGLSLTDD
jgi:hypothetical protein